LAKEDALAKLKEVADSIYVDGTTHIRNDDIISLGDTKVIKLFFDENKNTTYKLVKQTQSRVNKQGFYNKYQQYYKGIPVENGGFSTYKPNGYQPQPCGTISNGVLNSYRTYIFDDINISTLPKIHQWRLGRILDVDNNNIHKAELVISPNINGGCDYKLTWKVDYVDITNKRVWIDAQSGKILRQFNNTDFHINAPTELYGDANNMVFLNDSGTGVPGERILTTPDGSVTVYDHSGESGCAGPDLQVFDDVEVSELLPTTTGNTWTTNDAHIGTFQNFFVTEIVKVLFQNIQISFGDINVAANCVGEGAGKAIGGSTLANAFIAIGLDQDTGNSLATFDLIGHELAHVVLFDLGITDRDLESFTIHEAVADMIGTYIEAQRQGFVDWGIVDDVNTLRDLSDPEFNCMQTILDMENDGDNIQSHRRSTPISHWYYLISDAVSESIPSIGYENAIMIVLDALNNINNNDTFFDFMLQTIIAAEQLYGRCSNEFTAVARAWDLVCIPHPDTSVLYSCDFSISGPYDVCEEDEFIGFTIDGGFLDYNYRWTILGNNNSEFTSEAGLQGNTQHGGTTLLLNGFPDYSSYPQNVTIQLYCYDTGVTDTHVFEIKDCNDDNGGGGCKVIKKPEQFNMEIDLDKVNEIIIYSPLGKELFRGGKNEINLLEKYGTSILIVTYLDYSGNLIATKKHFAKSFINL